MGAGGNLFLARPTAGSLAICANIIPEISSLFKTQLSTLTSMADARRNFAWANVGEFHFDAFGISPELLLMCFTYKVNETFQRRISTREMFSLTKRFSLAVDNRLNG